MPCMSYDDDPGASLREQKKKTDMLARIACKALTELERNGIGDFLLLKDDEVREWWIRHQEADRKAREKEEKKQRQAELRAQALSKLTDEERRALGVKK